MLRLKSNLRKETGKNTECKLSSIQQNLVFKTFKPIQDVAEPNIPMAETLITQYYLMADVTTGNISGSTRDASRRPKNYLEDSIQDGYIKTEPNFEITDTQDGILAKVINTCLINNAHNLAHENTLPELITNFVSDIPGKKSKYLKDFIELSSVIQDHYTDLYMVHAEIEDARIPDAPKKPLLLIYAFVGNDYVICYNTTAEKANKLRSRNRSVVATRTKTGVISAYRVALSTLKKKTALQLLEVSKFDRVPQRVDHNVYNNMQEDCLGLNTIRKLSEVI